MYKFIILLLVLSFAPVALAAADLPDLSKTPGKVCITDLAKICNTKWGKDKRFVTDKMKQQVFANYSIPLNAQHDTSGKALYEIDHLISRELGGCDSIDNLWPQAYSGVWNAHVKDVLENKFHKEVCSGVLTLQEAQEKLRTNWILYDH